MRSCQDVRSLRCPTHAARPAEPLARYDHLEVNASLTETIYRSLVPVCMVFNARARNTEGGNRTHRKCSD